ncbi:hypothetical protein SLA2020_008940 [Shorea laevis]
MGDGNKISFSCSSSMKILCCIVPLVVTSLFVSNLVPKNSSWVSTSSLPSSSDDESSPSLNTSTETLNAEVEGGGEPVDLRRPRVVVDVHSVGDALSAEAVVSRAAAPPLAVETVRVQEVNETQETTVNITPSESPINDTVAVNDTLHLKPRKARVGTNLDKLETGLWRARVAIKEARNGNQLPDPGYVPIGPMYWDAKAFHRSYLEMEKQFKIFVYPEGEPPVFHDGPCKSIYSMEGNFIHKLDLDSKFQTKDPEKAHVFYLPFSVARMVQFVYVRDSHDFGPIKRTVIDYVELIARKYPYWNRSLGADHFMLSCHDWGPEASFSLPYLHKNSIRALCNANTSEKFNPIKDVSMPEINLQTGKLKGLVGGPSPSRRPILAFFAGGVHGPIRPVLLEHWENKDEDIRVHKYLPKGVSYYDMMRKSKYCICPSGYEVASPRIVEALYNGCVPVLISVSYVPPFSDVLNWKSFAVVLSVDDIPNLKNILTGISTRQYIRMQRRVLQVRRHFVFNSPPKRFDVFHMILHSIWLRRLNVEIKDDHEVVTN